MPSSTDSQSSIGIKIWRISSGEIINLEYDRPLSEKEIADILENHAKIISDRVVLLKREFDTKLGVADLLYITDRAGLVIVEVKKGGRPGEVGKAIFQLLSYGYWASKLKIRNVRDIVESLTGESLSEFLKKNFDVQDEIEMNDEDPVEYLLLLVSPIIDHRTDKVIEHLKEYSIPIDALTLHYFRDPVTKERYLARIYYTGEFERIVRRDGRISAEKFIEILSETGHKELGKKIVDIFSNFVYSYEDKGVRILSTKTTFGISLFDRAIDISFQVVGADQGYHGVWVKPKELRKKVVDIALKLKFKERGFDVRTPKEEGTSQKVIAFGRPFLGKTIEDTIEHIESFVEILPDFLEQLIALK